MKFGQKSEPKKKQLPGIRDTGESWLAVFSKKIISQKCADFWENVNMNFRGIPKGNYNYVNLYFTLPSSGYKNVQLYWLHEEKNPFQQIRKNSISIFHAILALNGHLNMIFVAVKFFVFQTIKIQVIRNPCKVIIITGSFSLRGTESTRPFKNFIRYGFKYLWWLLMNVLDKTPIKGTVDWDIYYFCLSSSITSIYGLDSTTFAIFIYQKCQYI